MFPAVVVWVNSETSLTSTCCDLDTRWLFDLMSAFWLKWVSHLPAHCSCLTEHPQQDVSGSQIGPCQAMMMTIAGPSADQGQVWNQGRVNDLGAAVQHCCTAT